MPEREATRRWALVTLCGLALGLLALLWGGVRLAPPAPTPAPTPTVTGGVTYTQLEALPEAHLFVPDAVPLRDFGGDATGPAFLRPGGQPAFTGHELGTPLTEREVLAFYTAQLATLGYGPPFASGWASGQGPSTTWRKGTLRFRYVTIYEIRLMVGISATPTTTAGATP